MNGAGREVLELVTLSPRDVTILGRSGTMKVFFRIERPHTIAICVPGYRPSNQKFGSYLN